MESVAVVLSDNTNFKKMFEEESPFVKGISYWTYMLKTELEKLNIMLVDYGKSEKKRSVQVLFSLR